MVYQWKPHVAFRVDVDPNIVGKRFEQIKKKSTLTRETVLADARDVNSPLHPLFEWNNTKAAEEYRLQQAGYLIRALEVIVHTGKSKETNVRAFVNVSDQSERQYLSITEAMSDPIYRQQLLDRALSEMETFQRKYAELDELADIFIAAEKVRQTVRKGKRPTKRAVAR